MGFACPVCETPQQDAAHLANHLAFTAMVNGDEHETWLDEHVPDWETHGESELAPKVAALAEETDYEQVFEDTARAHGHGGDGHQHGSDDHSRGSARGDRGGPAGFDPELAAAAGSGTLDEETRAILEEARELTAEMLGQGDEAGRDDESSAGEDDTERRD
ncbi:DUF5810 domain-containing protein [Halobellus rufus]|uniref:DUF5810 domain-containing protein n=1 Tax=Halobellus rufus TaxID=1448860 RepID=UPI000678DE88|nr:DUF5810 domain-containing protein [Halobellus rufus]